MTFQETAQKTFINTEGSLEHVVHAVLAHAATLLREHGEKASTYAKQEQWEAAAKLLEQAE